MSEWSFHYVVDCTMFGDECKNRKDRDDKNKENDNNGEIT